MSRKVTRNYEFSACSANYFCFCLGSVALSLIRFDLRGGASWIPAWSTLAVGLKGNACNVFFLLSRNIRTIRCLFCLRALSLGVCWRHLLARKWQTMALIGFEIKTHIWRARFKRHSIKWVCKCNGIVLGQPHPTPPYPISNIPVSTCSSANDHLPKIVDKQFVPVVDDS